MASFETPPPTWTRTGTPVGRISSTLLAPAPIRTRTASLGRGSLNSTADMTSGDLKAPQIQVLEVGYSVIHSFVQKASSKSC